MERTRIKRTADKHESSHLSAYSLAIITFSERKRGNSVQFQFNKIHNWFCGNDKRHWHKPFVMINSWSAYKICIELCSLSMITCFQFEMRRNDFASISLGKICFFFLNKNAIDGETTIAERTWPVAFFWIITHTNYEKIVSFPMLIVLFRYTKTPFAPWNDTRLWRI